MDLRIWSYARFRERPLNLYSGIGDIFVRLVPPELWTSLGSIYYILEYDAPCYTSISYPQTSFQKSYSAILDFQTDVAPEDFDVAPNWRGLFREP